MFITEAKGMQTHVGHLPGWSFMCQGNVCQSNVSALTPVSLWGRDTTTYCQTTAL